MSAIDPRPVPSLRERLAARNRALRGEPEPMPVPVLDPEPMQTKPKRAPRIAITQPTDAPESRTLRALQQMEIPAKPCGYCGRVFQPKFKETVYCGLDCRKRMKNDKQTAKERAAREPRTCQWCGRTFPSSKAGWMY